MMFCAKHNQWYNGVRCDKCLAGEPPYRYVRDEIADPNEWARYERMGWTR